MATGSLEGRGNQGLRILEEGFTGRCPPCLLGHRMVTRRSASPKLHKSLGNHASQPARRTGRERVEPRRITRTRPTSAPTNGWSRSSISVIWLTLARWTGPGGASSPTISPPSPAEPGRSRSSGSRPRRPRRRPRRSRLRRPRRRPRFPLLRPRSPPPRPPCPLTRAQPCPLPRAQQLPLLPQAELLPRAKLLPQAQPCSLPRTKLCSLPLTHPKVPRSAGCAAPRPAPSPT